MLSLRLCVCVCGTLSSTALAYPHTLHSGLHGLHQHPGLLTAQSLATYPRVGILASYKKNEWLKLA